MASKYKLAFGEVYETKLEQIANDFDQSAQTLENYARDGRKSGRLLISASESMRSCATEIRIQQKALREAIGDAIKDRSGYNGGLFKSTAEQRTESILRKVPGWMEVLAKKLLIDSQQELKSFTAETSMAQWADTLDLAQRLADFGKIDVDRELLSSASDIVKNWTVDPNDFSAPRYVPVGGDVGSADKLKTLYGAKNNLLEWCTKHKNDFPNESELIADTIKEGLAELTLDSPLPHWIWILNRSKTLSLLDGTEFDLDTRIPDVTKAIEWKAQPNFIDGGDPVDISVLDDVMTELSQWLESR
jgi:hypothetical protein